MKKNTLKRILTIILIIIISIASKKNIFAQDISINVLLEQPYPLELSAYTDLGDRLIVNITNTSAGSHNIRFELNISGPNGLELPAHSDLSNPFNIESGQTVEMNGDELWEYINFSEEDVEFGDYSREDIMTSGMLPEGEYNLCLSAFDLESGERLSNGEPDDCFTFNLNYAERPIIILPENESDIPANEIDRLTVSWTDPAFAMFGSEDIDIQYTIQLIDVEDTDYPDVPAEELFAPDATIFFEDITEDEGSGFTTYIIDDAGFELGHTYAIRITAQDLNNHIAYQYGGHSEVNIFTITGGSSVCSISDPEFDFQIDYLFPDNHDTLPFSFIPCVIEITPHCENFIRFNYTFFTAEDPLVSSNSYEREVEDRWPRGPRDYLVNDLDVPEPVGERPWQFITNLRDDQESEMPLRRGTIYDWSILNGIIHIGGESATADLTAKSYVYGMTKPVLSTPENNDTLSPGNINFEFNKGTSPENLLPETVKLLAADRGDIEGAQNIGNVRERWVLQIATSENFEAENIVWGNSGLVDESSDQSEETLQHNVYGEEALEHEFTDNGDYWWRVIWLKNPEMDIPENFYIEENDFYLQSSIRKFVIGSGGSGGDEEEVVGEKHNCDSECTIPEIENTEDISSLEENDTISVGQFTMTITEISQSGHLFSGQGKIALPFFEDKFLLVEFEDIKVNTDNRMYDGVVNGREKETCEFLSGLHNSAGNIPMLADSSDVENLVDWMDNAGQLLGNLTSSEEIGIPFGIDTHYGDESDQPVVFGVMETKFEPTQAMMSVIAAVGFEQINSTMGFGAQICFTPHGLTNDSTMFYLPMDHYIPYGEGEDEFGFYFKGGEPDEWENICHVKFGCNMTFLSGQMVMESDLPRETFIPVTDDNEMSEDENEHVKIRGRIRFTSPKSLLIGLDMDPFYINHNSAVYFVARDAWLDLSFDINPPDFEFPSNYDHASMHEGEMSGTWKGFYLKTIGLHVDSTLWKYSDDLNISFQNLIIDASGVTFNFGVYDILHEESSIADWQATLDTIELQVSQSEFDKFNISGRILPPMAADGEWMNYRLVLDSPDSSSGDDSDEESDSDEENGGNYYLEVNVEDSITVPIWVATMKFYDNSFIRLGYDDEGVYLTSLFNGRINISDQNSDESERNDIPGMDMSGIEFENLRLSTRRNDDGRYVSCDHFGFASPQKSVSGFPVSISDFELGSTDGLNGFYLGFDLTFALNQDSDSEGDDGENNSFSITGGLRFNASYVDRDGGGRKFRYEGISLTSIEIEADFSQIYLHGLLEWQKEAGVDQIHGLLEVGLPMGIGCKIEAIFGTYKNPDLENPIYNTEDYYDYWYVYGNVNLGSSGITIGPAVALYAFGGGVYHHMRLNTLYLDDAVLVSDIYTETAEKDEDGNAIGSTDALDANDLFERDVHTALGFRINALIATSGNSSVANFEVGVLAQFSETGGLSLLKINGAVYVMSEMASGDGNGKLWGTADITYSDYPETGKKLDGTIEIYLNIADILVGSIDDHYKMVDASFFSGNDIWYFHLGSYSDVTGINPGAAIALKLGDIELAELKAYMMIGYGIPQHLPPPPDKIARLVGLDTQNNNGQKAEAESPDIDSDVDYSSMQRGGESQSKLFSGTGFAFGTSLEVDAGFDAFIYFNLYLGIGFDLILTKFDEGIECEGFPDPGINRWYAMGQAYAGIEGELGIQFNFFGKRKIPLLYLGLGLYLKAYFPNPSYFEGRGGVHFEVLGGLIQGHKTFTIQKGDPCQIVIQDPLANIKFIEDVEPNGNEESIFSTPSVLFNFAMDRKLTIPKTIDSETGTISSYYSFKPTVQSFTVLNTGTNHDKEGRDVYKNHKKILQRKIANAFLGNTEYSINCEVRIKDYTHYPDHNANGEWYREDGMIWKEDTTVVFTTGNYPDVIPLENVKYSYPFNNQRHFLQAEGQRKGTVRLFMGMGSENGEGGLFPTEGDNGVTYSYVARFVNIEDENAAEHVLESTIDYSGGEWILFDIPNLENEKIYYCQILRISHFPQINNFSLSLIGSQSGNTGGSNMLCSTRPGLLRELLNTSTGYAVMRVDTLGPDDFLGKEEKRLYDFYFRTSKYNYMNVKLRGITVEGRTPGDRDDSANLKADIEIKNVNEPLEDFELKSQYYNVAGNRVTVPALYKFVDKYETSSYWQQKGRIYNSYQQIIDYGRYTSLCQGDYRSDCITEDITDRKYIKPHVPGILRINSHPSSSIYLGVDHTNNSIAPLSQEEIEDAWVINWENPGNTFNMMSFSGSYGGGASGSSTMMSTFSTEDIFYAPANDKILLSYSLPAAMAMRNEDWKDYINDFFYSRRGRVYDYHNSNRIRYYSNFELDHPLCNYIREENQAVYSTYRYILGKLESDYGFYTENKYINNGEFGGYWIFNTYSFEIQFNPPLPERYKRHHTRKSIHYRISKDNNRYRTRGLY